MKKYLIILVCVLLCGCVSTKKVRNQSLEVAKFDIEKFNGNYENRIDTISQPSYAPFEQLLFEQQLHKKAIINLYFNDKTTLTIKVIENGEVVSEKKMRGEIKDNYFAVKRKLLLVPIPIICYLHDEEKILLGNDNNGNMVLKLGHFHFGLSILVFVAGGYSYVSQYQYKKLN